MQNKQTKEECLVFMQNIAKDNGAELLDTEWSGWDSYYSFKLSNGNILKRKYSKIFTYGWNKSKVKYHNNLLNELQLISQNNNGLLIDTEWKGSKHKYCFKNEFGDLFYRSGTAIKSYGWPKNWNNYLSKNSNKKGDFRSKIYLLEKLKEISKNNLGKCLETTWLGIDKPHLFEDEFGKQFYSFPRKVFKGYWNFSRGLVSEPICRQVFEHLFNTSFPSTFSVLTPKILNRTKALELDGYSKSLNIAFEYQGYPSHWDVSHRNYNNTQIRDNLKKEFCKNLNIVLIEIPVFKQSKFNWNSKEVFNHITKIIIDTFKSLSIPLPTLNLSPFNIKFEQINHSKKQLKILKEIAIKHNGKLLSNIWKSANNAYLFENSNGEKFDMTIANYLKNGWPLNISKYKNHQMGHKKNDLDLLIELQNLAIFHNCKLLDNKWHNDSFKYSFLKPDNSIIKKSAYSIKRYGLNSKLSSFSDKQNKYLFLLNIGKENNATIVENQWSSDNYFYSFKILEKTYKFKYKFLKDNGWPNDLVKFEIFSNAKKKNSIDFYNELIEFANKNNGKVLSTEWLGNHTLHEFITEQGIVFQKKPVNIKRSGWYK